RVDDLALAGQVGIGLRRGSVDPPPRAARELPRRRRRAVDDRGDLVERDAEDVVQHEGDPLRRAQRVEHDEQRESYRIREQRLLHRHILLSRSVLHPEDEPAAANVTTATRRKHMNAIEVTRLSKTYPGGVEAVRGIDFEFAPGEVFGLLGPNGAGKSTTVGMLTTTILPTGGSARVAGFDVASEPLAARGLSSVVFQDPVVDGSLTGRRNLQIHARLWD